MQQLFDNVAPSPVIDLEALLSDYLLGLVLIAGVEGDTGSRPVQWVHSSDLADPTPFLTPRTVLLTTGAQFGDAAEAEPIDHYVTQLAAAGVTALGIGVGVQWERIPPALIEACDRARLPLFRVPYDTPFLAVVRTAARLIDTHRAEGWGREQSPPPGLTGRHERRATAESALRSAVLQLLIGGRRELADQVAAHALPKLPRGTLAVLGFADPLPPGFSADFGPVVSERPGVLAAALGGHTIVVAEVSLLAELRRVLTRHRVASGVSERGTVHELAELIEQAQRAAEIARHSDPPGPLDYRPAMHAGVLQLLDRSPEAVRRAQGLLAPLRRHDERHGDRLEESIACWLRNNGQLSPSANELGVHRHTLRNRVQTAADLLQRNFDDPDARAELWAAMRLSPIGGRPVVTSPEGAL